MKSEIAANKIYRRKISLLEQMFLNTPYSTVRPDKRTSYGKNVKKGCIQSPGQTPEPQSSD